LWEITHCLGTNFSLTDVRMPYTHGLNSSKNWEASSHRVSMTQPSCVTSKHHLTHCSKAQKPRLLTGSSNEATQIHLGGIKPHRRYGQCCSSTPGSRGSLSLASGKARATSPHRMSAFPLCTELGGFCTSSADGLFEHEM